MKNGKKPAINLVLPFRDTGGEKLLQFIWQFGYFNRSGLVTTAGEEITILFAGRPNPDGGPDFADAKIRIGETTLVGSVEIHLQTSHWEKHRHQHDRQYGNVVLHVVFSHDKELNHAIPVLELQPRVSTVLLEHYNALMNAGSFIPCGNGVSAVHGMVWAAWKERLLAERLTRKAKDTLSRLTESRGHWEETFWWLLARNFGGRLNGDAFEAMARSLSLTVLAKHRASVAQIEALLMGQAGLLREITTDDQYPNLLKREYAYLQQKLSLSPILIPLQFLRMRPGAFPTIRLSQLAALVHRSSGLFSAVVEAAEPGEIKALFSVTANDFWHTHYTFHEASAFKPKNVGAETVNNLLINTVIPVLFAFGQYHNDEQLKEKALRWLGCIEPEQNSITRGFAALGIPAASAYDTQALIELKNQYCNARRCLQCAVGNHLLKRDATQAGVGQNTATS